MRTTRGQHHSRLRIKADATALLRDLRLLAQAAKRSAKVRQLLLDCGDLAAQLRCVNLDARAAGRAHQLRIGFEFSDRLAQLAAALRAGDVDGATVEC